MFKTSVVALALALSFSAQIFAQEAKKSEGQTTIKIEDTADSKNKVEGNIDEEITNAKLRAESGSKSKWSLSVTAQYNGGSLEKPIDKNRPNPTNDPIPPKTTMSGDIGVRYRADKNQSFQLGTGYGLEQPFHAAKRGQVSTPYVSYNYATKIGQVQNIAKAKLSFATNSDDIEIGTRGSVSVDDTIIYDFNGSRLSVGVLVGGYFTDYSKKNEIVEPNGAPRNRASAYQEDYGLAVYPFSEFAISDKVQIRTVFRPWIYNHRRAAEGWTFARRPWTQSLGVGFAVTRDIYLYPNFQWDVENWRRNDYSFFAKPVASTSTVGLSATLNVF